MLTDPGAPRVSAPRSGSDVQRGTVRRWMVIVCAAVAFGVAVYLLAVWTVPGQTIENGALRGADQADAVERSAAVTALGHITAVSLLVATVLICTVALLRRQPVLAFAAGAIIVGGQVVTQTLKRFVLPRPELVEVSSAYAHNSLPSGHTTIAMTVLIATMIVVPYRFRGLAMFVVLTWAVGVGSYTIVAKWHRLSDTLAADAVSLAVASAVCLALVRTGHLRVVPAVSGRHTLRTIFVVILALLGAVSAALGTLLLALTWNRPPIDAVSEDNFFLGAHSLSWAGSIFAALVFWWSLRRVSLEDAARR